MYLSGFGNHHQTEAIPNALPTQQNSPQKCNLNLFAEQISGSAFTRQRGLNLHSWLYRKNPSVTKSDYVLHTQNICKKISNIQSPNPLRWSAQPIPSTKTDFLNGITHIAGNKNLNTYIYQCNTSMQNDYFNNHDGELIFVPYFGEIELATEFGILQIKPGLIAVIPRGVSFKVIIQSPNSAGYLGENKGLPLTLPNLGPIGANGLANPRHFLYPTASFEDNNADARLFCKYDDKIWVSEKNISPLNVVAWHGNYAPYQYDLSLFNTINTVSFDHPDPSIFTVLTSESEIPGIANLDFVIFPARWMVAEHTFRPPYFHRNIMNELMGLIDGKYDAKASGFEVGGISIHNGMTPHGPDAISYENAIKTALKPEYYQDTLAFMFESNNRWHHTDEAYNHHTRQQDYTKCWQGFYSQ